MNDALFHTTKLGLKPDAEGEVMATLLAYTPSLEHQKAVLYVHGFVDYFFQEHLAKFFHQQGWAFYAIDLRKYGRSLLPHQTPNYVDCINEYYEELEQAVVHIKQQHPFLLLGGHSTGGLTAPLFVAESPVGQQVDALFLNSPFFAMNYPDLLRKSLLPVLSTIGKWMPRANLYAKLSKLYGMSLHQSYYGEWDYNLQWKPIEGFNIYGGWIRAIYRAQCKLQKGLKLTQPTLILHSDKSINRLFTWTDQLMHADAVLNVKSMVRYAPQLSQQVNHTAIQGAMHDIFLSKQQARESAFKELANWLQTIR